MRSRNEGLIVAASQSGNDLDDTDGAYQLATEARPTQFLESARRLAESERSAHNKILASKTTALASIWRLAAG